MPRAPVVPKKFVRQTFYANTYGLSISRRAVEALQEAGEDFVAKFIQKLTVIAQNNGDRMLLERHFRTLEALQRIDESCDVSPPN
jgi:hypothetical protein